jgi:hypothetical protein
MRDADSWAEQLVHDQLPNTRKLGQQWAATVTALTGLFGLGIVIDADDAVHALTTGWAIAYGVLVGVAVLAAAAAILLASLASHGWLATIPPGVQERIALRHDLVRKAHSQLRLSWLLTGIALLFLIGSFGVRWYGPQEKTPAEKAAAVRR